MSFASVLLLPLAMLSPALSAVAPEGGTEAVQPADVSRLWPDTAETQDWIATASTRLRPVEDKIDEAWQVRIEQRVIIRITPRGPSQVPPDMLVSMPERAQHYQERSIGNCIPAAAIAGVQPDRGNRLLLFLRDQRVLRAELERSCRAMDFYSGFYISRSSDGKVCVNRDKLQSRSGMKCSLTRIYQLVETR